VARGQVPSVDLWERYLKTCHLSHLHAPHRSIKGLEDRQTEWPQQRMATFATLRVSRNHAQHLEGAG
jgi:hypothetical protein